MVADLKEREPNTVTPFVIVNFSHHEHLHLPKDHVVAFAEKENGRKSSVNFSRSHSCKKTKTS